MNIRLLKPNEIDVRVLTINEKGFSVLLYKDARVDMAILDEVFGIYGWQRKHEVINNNLFCTISIYDKDTQQWIDKQDVGTESYTEKEKGQASDSFKRAAVNVGIGRELYTAPSFMWIAAVGDVKEVKGKYTTYTKLRVSEIGYNDLREINQLVIVDDKDRERYRLGKSNTQPKMENKEPSTPKSNLSENQIKRLYAIGKSRDVDKAAIDKSITTQYKKNHASELTKQEYDDLCGRLEALPKKE